MSIAALAVLARYVPPSAYGLMGMATTISNFLLMFRDLGTASALIQRKNVDEALLASVFWLNVVLGVVLTGLTALIAWPASWFYKEPNVVPVMQIVSLTFLASSLSMVHLALLTREMKFRRIAVAELGGAAVGYGASITMAVLGYGVWSLAIGNLAVMVTTTLLFWVVRPWRPRSAGSYESIKSIAAYSLNLLGFSIVNYFSRNVDSLVVGRWLGAAALGYYQMAYNVMMYPIQNVTQVLGRVMLPTFSRIQDDDERFRNAYIRVTTVISLVTFPMMLGLMAVCEPFVLTIVGKQWQPIVPLLLILCPIGMAQSVMSSVGYIYTAKGRTDWMFRWSIAALFMTIPGFLVGLRWGIYGVATGYACAMAVMLYPVFAVPFRLIRMPFLRFARAFWPVLKCAAGMALVVWGVEALLDRAGVKGAGARLFTGVGAGLVTYLAFLALEKPLVVRHLADLMRDTGRERFAQILERFAPGKTVEIVEPGAILKGAHD